ncbi:MAG: 1-acyl-sn-glycerol-3-phosphate acyltransferase [SAR86 cluster bacterium]|nr:1-acyl-sn-glycerol-3-phosphate acyltransferase [SAR86 cluster bacterium]
MDYRDISSYSDEHVAEKIQELEADVNFHQYIANLIFPVANRFFSKFTNNYVKKKFHQQFSSCDSIEAFQGAMAPFVLKMIENTTDGFSYSGLENLSDKPTLFIGNHRDISLDAAFLNYLLYENNMKTVKIAIGDNLLDGSFAESLMRLNKSFIVHREIKGVKETLRKLTKLSSYINYSLTTENESIWIAQREGRANDGNDFTDEGVLKMLYLNQRKEVALSDWVEGVNLTPISISYEYDPLDLIKAKGWRDRESLTQEEISSSDLNEMATGIFGYKGKVHLHICKPVSFKGNDIRNLAKVIEKDTIENYKVWPISYAAISLLPDLQLSASSTKQDTETKKELMYFKKRFKSIDPDIVHECLMTYARPLINKEKARLSTGP